MDQPTTKSTPSHPASVSSPDTVFPARGVEQPDAELAKFCDELAQLCEDIRAIENDDAVRDLAQRALILVCKLHNGTSPLSKLPKRARVVNEPIHLLLCKLVSDISTMQQRLPRKGLSPEMACLLKELATTIAKHKPYMEDLIERLKPHSQTDIARAHQALDAGLEPPALPKLDRPAFVFLDVSNIAIGAKQISLANHVRIVRQFTGPQIVRVIWSKLLNLTLGPLPKKSQVVAIGSADLKEGFSRILTDESIASRTEDKKIIDFSVLQDSEWDAKFLKHLSQLYVWNDSAWKKHEMIRDYRPRAAGEKCVDTSLVARALQCAADAKPNDQFFIFSGDADYIPLYETLLQKSMRVTVFAWHETLNPAISRLDGVIVNELDYWYNQICYSRDASAVEFRPCTTSIAIPLKNLPSDLGERQILLQLFRDGIPRNECYIDWETDGTHICLS